MGGYMRDRGCLSGGESGFPRRSRQLPGRSHGVAAGRPSLGHGGLAANPGQCHFERMAGAFVFRARLREKGEHVSGALDCPNGQQAMVGLAQGAAAPDGHQPGIADLGEDHNLLTRNEGFWARRAQNPSLH